MICSTYNFLKLGSTQGQETSLVFKLCKTHYPADNHDASYEDDTVLKHPNSF